MAKFLMQLLTVVALGFAAFTYVDFATAALLPWWNFTFMWAVLLVAGMVVAALSSLRSPMR